MSLKNIPSVSAVLNALDLSEINVPLPFITDVVRNLLNGYRKQAKNGEMNMSQSEIVKQIKSEIKNLNSCSLNPVINGTGIVLHTGLGRAPISETMMKNLSKSMTGYSSLEFDVKTGKRGERNDHVEPLLKSLTGSEKSLVVNNNAAAVLLALNTLAEGKEVIVSRGQLVEIGGSFRIPDVIRKSSAIMVEVGTTNRSHLNDYKKAVTANTGMILVVHTSNYLIEGFTKEVLLSELRVICRKKKIPLVVDLGSGALQNLEDIGLPKEPVVVETLKSGADLVTFSGDKLLGGPQSGIICGKKRLVSRLHKNPLYRTLRCNKITLSHLELTLRDYENSAGSNSNLATRMFTTPQKMLLKRGNKIVAGLTKKMVLQLGLKVISSRVEAGSGSLPTKTIESAALKFDPAGTPPSKLSQLFRETDIPIVGYISANKFYIDLKAVLPKQDSRIASTINQISKKLK